MRLGVFFAPRETIQEMSGTPCRNLSPNRANQLGPAREALTLIELWCEIKLGRYIKPRRCSDVPCSLCSGSYWSWRLWNKLRTPRSRKILWAYECLGPEDSAIRPFTLMWDWIHLFPSGFEVARADKCQIWLDMNYFIELRCVNVTGGMHITGVS